MATVKTENCEEKGQIHNGPIKENPQDQPSCCFTLIWDLESSLCQPLEVLFIGEKVCSQRKESKVFYIVRKTQWKKQGYGYTSCEWLTSLVYVEKHVQKFTSDLKNKNLFLITNRSLNL